MGLRLFLCILLINTILLIRSQEIEENDNGAISYNFIELEQKEKLQAFEDYLNNEMNLDPNFRYKMNDRTIFQDKKIKSIINFKQNTDYMGIYLKAERDFSKSFDINRALFSVTYQDKIPFFSEFNLNKVIIGDFRLQHGKGIVLSTSSSFNTPSFQTDKMIARSLLKTNQSTFSTFRMRGIALDFQWKNLTFLPYFSHQKYLGLLDENGDIQKLMVNQESSINEDKIFENCTGLITEYKNNKINSSFLIFHQRFSKSFADKNNKSDILILTQLSSNEPKTLINRASTFFLGSTI